MHKNVFFKRFLKLNLKFALAIFIFKPIFSNISKYAMIFVFCFHSITIEIQSPVVVSTQISNRSILISMLRVKKTTVSSSPASLNTESHVFINYLQNHRLISIPHERFLEIPLRHSCERPIRLMMQTTVVRLKHCWRTKCTKTDLLVSKTHFPCLICIILSIQHIKHNPPTTTKRT